MKFCCEVETEMTANQVKRENVATWPAAVQNLERNLKKQNKLTIIKTECVWHFGNSEGTEWRNQKAWESLWSYKCVKFPSNFPKLRFPKNFYFRRIQEAREASQWCNITDVWGFGVFGLITSFSNVTSDENIFKLKSSWNQKFPEAKMWCFKTLGLLKRYRGYTSPAVRHFSESQAFLIEWDVFCVFEKIQSQVSPSVVSKT